MRALRWTLGAGLVFTAGFVAAVALPWPFGTSTRDAGTRDAATANDAAHGNGNVNASQSPQAAHSTPAPGANNAATREGAGPGTNGFNELHGAWGRFQTGDYEGAIALLRAELAARPTDENVRSNLATALFALALVRIKAQQYADAEKLLEESARMGNRDAERTAASLKLKLGNVDLASSLFEELFDATSDAASLRVLVDVSLRNDDLDRAEYFLGKLPEEDGFARARRRRLEQKRSFARTQDTVERGAVEVAFAHGLPRSLASAVASAMDETLGELASLLGPVPAGTRLKAFLYPSESFQEQTGAPPWAGGLFDGLISIPVPRGRQAAFLQAAVAKVARHETTHAYLYSFCGDLIPSWLGEGLAQRFEGTNPSQAVSDLKRRGTLRDVRLLDGPFTRAPEGEVTRLYAQSFLLVDHLTKQGGGLSYWRGPLQRACQGRESLPVVLASETGSESAAALWEKHGTAALLP